jgi:hypothetical protein
MCLRIQNADVSPFGVLFHVLVVRNTTCDHVFRKSPVEIGCGSVEDVGSVGEIRFAEMSGSTPVFADVPHINVLPASVSCKVNLRVQRTVDPFIRIGDVKYTYIDPTSIRLCTKLYVDKADPRDDSWVIYKTHRWLQNVHDVALYALDDNFRTATLNRLRSHPRVRLFNWSHWRVPRSHYERQHDSAVSDIEAMYRNVVSHCVWSSVGAIAWVFVADLDERLHVVKPSQWTGVLRRSHKVSLSNIHYMENGSPCPYIYHTAVRAATNRSIYRELSSNSLWQSVLAWKGLLTPRFVTYAVAAHVRGGALVSPEVAYLTHNSFSCTCHSECCCTDSPCKRPSC